VCVCVRSSVERQPWYFSVPRARQKVIKTRNILRDRCGLGQEFRYVLHCRLPV